MILDDLKAEARRMADDTAATPLYDDEFMDRTFNEAEREACARALLIFDDTSDFLEHAVTASMDPNIELDPRVIDVEYCTYQPDGATRKHVVPRATLRDIRKMDPGGNCSRSCPDRFVPMGKTIRIWPSPNASSEGTLRLSVHRYPLEAMVDGADEPEIEERWHVDLVHWVLYKAFLTKDGDEGDAELSDKHLGLFEARFGPRRNDNAAAVVAQRNGGVTTRYGGIP